MKTLVGSITYSCYGTSTIHVPDSMTLKEAIEYAKKHIDEIATPSNGEYIPDSDVIDDEYCKFTEHK